MDFDVFNGDADGLCALHQLRMAEPRGAQLITGVKRDISLLKRIAPAPGLRITALDISIDKNIGPLEALLAAGASVEWFDHHQRDHAPDHPHLKLDIDTAAHMCTSLIVDRALGGRYRAWAVAAAFGDNLPESAKRAAMPLGLSKTKLDALRELGEALNYNAYGERPEDLHYRPEELYRALHEYEDPLVFIEEAPQFDTLREGYEADLDAARAIDAHWSDDSCALHVLPAEAWARRVCGVWGNELAVQSPARAHAVLVQVEGGYQVSVRAPLCAPHGADRLCAMFPTGGGRKGAAGINLLDEARLNSFIDAFAESYGKRRAQA